jgi:hypothetical protein
METWEHIKMGEHPLHNALRFFCWGRSLKIHLEIFKKSDLCMVELFKNMPNGPILNLPYKDCFETPLGGLPLKCHCNKHCAPM